MGEGEGDERRMKERERDKGKGTGKEAGMRGREKVHYLLSLTSAAMTCHVTCSYYCTMHLL